MCRIAGAASASLSKEEITNLVGTMCRVQQHGGPDDEGFFSIEGFNGMFGHRRLSIIDISPSGHQPMTYSNNRFVISYNGEIYNYLELKSELQLLGCQFTTHSDTEVILAAYEKWGISSFERLNGMFAFAVYDKENKEITLARDPSGIKPLYYAATNEIFAFASEVRALKQIPQLQQENKNWQVYLMAYGHLPEPVTTLQKVQPLQKGFYLKYNLSEKKYNTASFDRFKYLEKINKREDAIQLVQQTLEDAVKRHLISDAPIGVFLSGGLDSGIIALLAAKHQQQLNTVSLYFEDGNFSEKQFQDELLKKISCSNHQFLLQENDFHTALPSIISNMDLPCCDGINTWFISKYAKDSGLKTVLSGIGGDELFGGYPSFERMKTALLLSKLPHNFLKAGRFANYKQLKRLCYLSIDGPVGKYLFLRGQFIPADIARFLNADEAEVWNILEEQPQLNDIAFLSAGNQASWIETNMYMQNQLLRDADTMSMAHGLEIRVPFLDKEFAQLAFKIKSNIKYDGKLGKQLLIDSFKDELPESIWNRPKMGFSFPFKEWFSNNNYATASDGTNLGVQHTKLKSNQMHWSHFFTLLLMHSYGKA